MFGLGGEVWVMWSQCQPGSSSTDSPGSALGLLWAVEKLWKLCINQGVSAWNSVERNFTGPPMELESWNIITASLKLEKTPRTNESDLQNLRVQLLKHHSTFTGNSQDFHGEFPQTFQAFSTTAKAGISPWWAQTHTHTRDFVAFLAHVKMRSFCSFGSELQLQVVVMGHEKGGWEHRGRIEDKGR